MVSLLTEDIWETFHTPLAQFIRARVDDPAAADDLLQDVYVKIHTNLSHVRDEERLQGWVYQIARNAVNDYYRRLKPNAPLDETGTLLAGISADTSDEDAEAEQMRQRLALSLRLMIDQLPEHYRQAVILAELEGMSQREMAERLGLSLSGAKSRVQRGRALLHEMMLACCHFQLDRYGTVIDYTPRSQTCVNQCGSTCNCNDHSAQN